MPEALAAIVGWIVPAVIVFAVAAGVIAAIVWAVRRARRSPKARAEALAQRDRAGAGLVRLDDAVAELDLEVGLSGALYGGGAPASLRRARLQAQRVREDSFAEYRALGDPDVLPDDIRRAAARIGKRTSEALGLIAKARGEHEAWVAANVSAAAQVEAARTRLAALREQTGDPTALVAELSQRFAESEWAAAARAARSAQAELAEADRLLARAAASVRDPSRSALTDLASAERALRQAEGDARALEEAHSAVTQAALAVPGELEAMRTAMRTALATRAQLEPDDAERLGAELRDIDGEIATLSTDAARHPTRTVDTVARLRGRLDLALGDAATAQQRLRGARTALPGTLASARGAVARAEVVIAHAHVGIEARSRLASAQAELASARQQTDPVAALDAARRALRDADDAAALAAYDGLTVG